MPLSEYEQRVLDQLEAQLTSEDPKLGSRMAAANSPRRGRVALGACGGLLGLVLLVTGVAASQVWISPIGFVIMFIGVYFALTSPKERTKTPPAANQKPRKPGLSERFQQRLDGDGR
jgi:hypothetical protein